jgi:hypothetical protein
MARPKQLVGHVIEIDTVVPAECGQEISELYEPVRFTEKLWLKVLFTDLL